MPKAIVTGATGYIGSHVFQYGKAKFRLGWSPRLNIDQTVSLTIDWFKRYTAGDVYDLCLSQLAEYLSIK